MSQIAVMKTVFTDRNLLIEALKDLGYTVTEGERLSVSDGQRSCAVDFLAQSPYSGAIGFRHGKNGWQALADWFRVLEKRETFRDRLHQQYAYLAVKQNLTEQGFQISEEKQDEKNQIHLILRRVS